jgi:hypothetical protein
VGKGQTQAVSAAMQCLSATTHTYLQLHTPPIYAPQLHKQSKGRHLCSPCWSPPATRLDVFLLAAAAGALLQRLAYVLEAGAPVRPGNGEDTHGDECMARMCKGCRQYATQPALREFASPPIPCPFYASMHVVGITRRARAANHGAVAVCLSVWLRDARAQPTMEPLLSVCLSGYATRVRGQSWSRCCLSVCLSGHATRVRGQPRSRCCLSVCLVTRRVRAVNYGAVAVCLVTRRARVVNNGAVAVCLSGQPRSRSWPAATPSLPLSVCLSV